MRASPVCVLAVRLPCWATSASIWICLLFSMFSDAIFRRSAPLTGACFCACLAVWRPLFSLLPHNETFLTATGLLPGPSAFTYVRICIVSRDCDKGLSPAVHPIVTFPRARRDGRATTEKRATPRPVGGYFRQPVSAWFANRWDPSRDVACREPGPESVRSYAEASQKPREPEP